MIDNNEILQLFGSDMMFIDKQQLSMLDVPIPTKDWLATIGIPKKAQLPYGLTFNGLNQVEPVITKSQPGVIVGESEGPTYFVIREDGIILLLDKIFNQEVFINTTIDQFIMSLCKFIKLTENEFSTENFRDYLNKIDANAILDGESFWSVAIEDMVNLQL